MLLAALLTNAPSLGSPRAGPGAALGGYSPGPDGRSPGRPERAAILYVRQKGIAEEFQRLFVGLGSGELVPYASWYLEKMIQSAPLAAIRADLGRLGIVRQSTCFEPEDHAGVLCEIMALLSVPENDIAEEEQAAFFRSHH